MKPSKSSRAKAQRIAAVRKELRLSLLAERGPYCQACPFSLVGATPPRPWSEMHEILTRGRGGDPTDANNILCLCATCHRWVTTHENDARSLGLVRARTADEHRAAFRPWGCP